MNHAEQVTMWRAVMEFAQAAGAVLEREIPASLGLPPPGMMILRLLRWDGPQSREALAKFLGVSPERLSETLENMLEEEWIRPVDQHADRVSDALELAPAGICLAQRIVTRQRKSVERGLNSMDEESRSDLGKGLVKLSCGLLSQSRAFDIVCGQCWAYDQRECIQPGAEEHCPFRTVGRAQLDPA